MIQKIKVDSVSCLWPKLVRFIHVILSLYLQCIPPPHPCSAAPPQTPLNWGSHLYSLLTPLATKSRAKQSISAHSCPHLGGGGSKQIELKPC